MRGRRRIVVLGAAAATVVCGLGFAASQWIRSPEQAAADAAPPRPTELTATVDKRIFKSTVVLRGDVAAGQQFEVTPTPRETGGKAVVTGVRARQGDTISAGAVLLEVSGRPLIALPGEVPAYRDLRPGSSGKDVTQLQAALKSLGHDPRETNGVYGPGTKTAVAALYEAIGHSVPTTGEDDQKNLESARTRVKQAERGLADARDAGGDPKTVARAAEDVTVAKKDLAELEKRTGPMLPAGEVVFLPGFPARVVASQAQVGGEVKAPLVTVSSGALQVSGLLNPGQRNLVQPGQPVEITSESMSVTASGRVASVGDLVDEKSTGGRGHKLVVQPDTALDAKLAGQNVRVTIATAASEGEVLVVPVSALFATADGGTNVIRKLPDGKREKVLVITTVSGGGFVAVRPVTAGQLGPGDKVVISADNLAGTGG
jgi:HlyD family secretion protein